MGYCFHIDEHTLSPTGNSYVHARLTFIQSGIFAFIDPRCRSPPPPFRPKNLKVGTATEITIQINGQTLSVTVTVEVYEYLDQADHKDENLAHEQRRHWDMRELDEYIIANESSRSYILTPEQIVCRKETLAEIMAVLNSCTETQRERFFLYALEGMSFAEIWRRCDCSKGAVQNSISWVRKKYQDISKNRPYEMPF